MSMFGNTALLSSKPSDSQVKEIKKKEISKNTTRYYSDYKPSNSSSSFSDYSYGSDDCSSSSDSSSCD